MLDIQTICPCCMSMLHGHVSMLQVPAACPRCMSMMHEHVVWTWKPKIEMSMKMSLKIKMNIERILHKNEKNYDSSA
jgi:hypothetical protein